MKEPVLIGASINPEPIPVTSNPAPITVPFLAALRVARRPEARYKPGDRVYYGGQIGTVQMSQQISNGDFMYYVKWDEGDEGVYAIWQLSDLEMQPDLEMMWQPGMKIDAAKHQRDDRLWDETPKPIVPGSEVVHESVGWHAVVEKLNTGASAADAAAYVEWTSGPEKGKKGWVGLGFLKQPIPQRTLFAAIKTAITLPEIVRETNAFSKKYRPGCSPKLLDSNPKALFLHYNVTCNKEDSDPAGHDVRIQFDVTHVAESQQAKDLDVQVSCSCPAFLYWGAQWNLHMRDGLLGSPRPQLTTPTERLDLRQNFVICKHIHSVFERILPSVQHNIVKILREREVQKNKEKMKETPSKLKEKQDEMKRKREEEKILKEKDKDIQQKMLDSLQEEEEARLLHQQQLDNQGAPGPVEEEEVEESTMPTEQVKEVAPEEEDIHALEELAQQEEKKIQEQHKKHVPHEHKGLPYEIHEDEGEEGWTGARVSSNKIKWKPGDKVYHAWEEHFDTRRQQCIVQDQDPRTGFVRIMYPNGDTKVVNSLNLKPWEQQKSMFAGKQPTTDKLKVGDIVCFDTRPDQQGKVLEVRSKPGVAMVKVDWQGYGAIDVPIERLRFADQPRLFREFDPWKKETPITAADHFSPGQQVKAWEYGEIGTVVSSNHRGTYVVEFPKGKAKMLENQLEEYPKQQNMFKQLGTMAKAAMRFEDIKKGLRVFYIPSASANDRIEGTVMKVDKANPESQMAVGVQWDGQKALAWVPAWTVGRAVKPPQESMDFDHALPIQAGVGYTPRFGEIEWVDIQEGEPVMKLDQMENNKSRYLYGHVKNKNKNRPQSDIAVLWEEAWNFNDAADSSLDQWVKDEAFQPFVEKCLVQELRYPRGESVQQGLKFGTLQYKDIQVGQKVKFYVAHKVRGVDQPSIENWYGTVTKKTGGSYHEAVMVHWTSKQILHEKPDGEFEWLDAPMDKEIEMSPSALSHYSEQRGLSFGEGGVNASHH